MTQMVQQAIRLGYHPREWKRARGILHEKGGKQDLTLVKSYRVISLLNCMGKLVEKVIAEQLSQFSENFLKLHQGQMGARKERCAIDIVASLIHEVEQQWAKKKLAAALFVDVKGVFDHVSKTQLIARTLELEVDGNLVCGTKSFLTNRKLQLVIDGHKPVYPYLFIFGNC